VFDVPAYPDPADLPALFQAFADTAAGLIEGVIVCTTATRPATPVEGQHIYDTDIPSTFVWNGAAWVEIAGSGGMTISDTAPTVPAPDPGDMWFDSTTGITYLRYDSFWVEVGAGVVATSDTLVGTGLKHGSSPTTNIVLGDDGTTLIKAEPAPTVALSANVETLDLNVSAVTYILTAPTANWTLNVTNAPTDEDVAVTVTVFCTQGATGYIPSTFQVAGVGQTIKWQGGTAPTPTSTAGKIDIFSFTIVRKSAAWVVFGSALTGF
jgi:hypothetical protein